ncbi:acyltransferase [Pantoea sp. BAV 3049]|uniref:acyltransferase family protein n=1 Tax=Pantoea sp. BAV 3049 TaxID=2654188 RepID=UPI00131BA672|nr:acyltransferase [Pantoea sp. BAV 3049]
MRARIQHLDGMRGLAILLVIGFHAYSRWPEMLHYVSRTKDFPLFAFGYLGVPLFFMISGFVIFMTLDKSESYISFLKKRWLRLFPAMFIVSLMIYLTANLFPERPAGSPTLLNLVPGLIFTNPETLSMLSGVEFKSLEGSFWSLYVEAVFYILIGAVYYLAGRKYCLPALILPMLVLSAASAIKMMGYAPLADVISKFGFIHYSWFMIGCLVYERLHNRDKLYHYGLTFIAILINLSFYVKTSGLSVLLPLAMAFILFIASFYSPKLEKILSTPFLTAIGFVSYALYLIHENLMIALLVKLDHAIKNDYVMMFMSIPVVTMIYLIALFITKYAEPAFRDMLKRKRKQPQIG